MERRKAAAVGELEVYCCCFAFAWIRLIFWSKACSCRERVQRRRQLHCIVHGFVYRIYLELCWLSFFYIAFLFFLAVAAAAAWRRE